jgi:hypothetical protein
MRLYDLSIQSFCNSCVDKTLSSREEDLAGKQVRCEYHLPFSSVERLFWKAQYSIEYRFWTNSEAVVGLRLVAICEAAIGPDVVVQKTKS